MGPVRSPSVASDHGSPRQTRTLEEELAGGPFEVRWALALLALIADTLDDWRQSGLASVSIEPSAVLIGDVGGENPSVDLRIDDVRRADSHQYVPPERLMGRDEGPAADVYSLTVLLYRCLTGQVPFPQARRRAALFWHLHAPRPRPTELRPALPAAVDDVIARGMAPDPAARHPNAHALLEHAREALGATATPPHAQRPALVDARSRRRRRALVRLALALGAPVAAGVLGFAVAAALDDPSPRSAVATAGPLRLTVPAHWRPSPVRESLLGVPLADPVAFAPDSRARERVVAGIAPTDAIVALLRRLRSSPPSGERVALAGMEARRYDGPRTPGSDLPMVLYVAPSDVGVATVACLADDVAAARSFMPRCGRVAALLRLARGRSGPAGPTGRQATGLRRAVRRLNAARSAYRSRLARAGTVTRQAAAARALARAHARQAAALRSLGLTGLAQPGARAAIGALARSAAAYRSAARAAARRRPEGYARARRSVLAADADLRDALRLLRVVGYAG